MNTVEPLRQLVAPLVKTESVVIGNVVTAPHEHVDGAQRIAFGTWKDGKTVVKIPGGRAGVVATHRVSNVELRGGGRELHGSISYGGAHSIFPNAARATRASLRVFEIAGRRPRTA